ncbi:MAG: hypothetical protein O7G30_10255 [Proteobacteria bacterium]|nr:hypothetical protein [Pseudomonadota bacterium]
MSYRVIQWYTGSIAREQIRMIQSNPELELVGAVVHHEAKAGIDVGDIMKGEATGVTTVGNIRDGLAINADVVLYNAPFERYDEIIRILETGKNVITPSAAFFPWSRPELSEIETACEKGGVTLLGTGVNPGFAGDVLPLVASSLCARVDRVHIQEVGELSGWDPFMLTEVMKFGREVKELEDDASYFDLMSNSFQQSCRMLAEALNFEVDNVSTRPGFARAKRDLLDGRVKRGTVAGIHLQVVVTSKGSPVVTEDLYWKLDDDLALSQNAAWDLDPDAGEWQITIEGNPIVKLGAQVSRAKGQGGAGQVATGARMVNSIKDVCEAAPGILTAATAPMPRCWNFPTVA